MIHPAEDILNSLANVNWEGWFGIHEEWIEDISKTHTLKDPEEGKLEAIERSLSHKS
jgi:hypothetical protein